MLRLLERNIALAPERLLVLPPPSTSFSRSFGRVTADPHRREQLLRELQRLRGSVYLNDGAIGTADLTSDGCHRTPEDEQSWHLVVLSTVGRVSGCIWYLEHDSPRSLDRLRVRNCPLVHDAAERAILRSAVEGEMTRARRERVRYAEVGGWATARGSRVADCLLLLLATYSLSQIRGGALGLATATVRHSSAAILRRIGGVPLEANGTVVPPYYDERYKCEMELLRFDSRHPGARFERLIAFIRILFASIPLIAAADTPVECSANDASGPRAFGLAHGQPDAALA